MKSGIFLLFLICLNCVTSNQFLSFAADSLKDAFQGKFKIGTSVSPFELNSGGEFIKKHFNSITPENELKPDSILSQQGCQQYGNNVNTIVNFGQGTRQTLSFCERNRIPLRGHTFVWYSQTPDWFFRENFNQENSYISRSKQKTPSRVNTSNIQFRSKNFRRKLSSRIINKK